MDLVRAGTRAAINLVERTTKYRHQFMSGTTPAYWRVLMMAALHVAQV
jgi:hypothetical protein